MTRSGLRLLYLLLGLLFTGLGLVGAFLPLLPTVPFLLLAVWCFARSSQKLHTWLYTHPRWGPPIRDWDKYGVVPIRAKILSCSMMSFSMILMLLTTDLALWHYAAIAVFLTAVGVWIVTRPSHPPPTEADGASLDP